MGSGHADIQTAFPKLVPESEVVGALVISRLLSLALTVLTPGQGGPWNLCFISFSGDTEAATSDHCSGRCDSEFIHSFIDT